MAKDGTTTRDVRDWDEEGYRSAILQERELHCRTIFRTVFAPSINTTENPRPDIVVTASSDGSIACYSISSCISSTRARPARFSHNQSHLSPYCISLAEPLCFIQGHKGPAYDVKFYGEGENPLLLSCGDDGRIQGWRWKDVLNYEYPVCTSGSGLNVVLDLLNPQHKGPWNSLSPVPENNAIDVNTQEGSIYSAAGDACAYCWDVETSKRKMVFKGHTDYLHCIVARKSSNQIITGSEDGTARIWDCKSGKCTQVIHPGKDSRLVESSWMSCIAIDASESWLVCGNGKKLSLWNIPSCASTWNVDTGVPVQDVLFDCNQILSVGSDPLLTRFSINGMVLSQIQCASRSAFSVACHPSGVTAVSGYGGTVDVISEYGSHLCTFCCQGM